MADYELLIRDHHLDVVAYLWPREGAVPPLSIRWTRNWRNPGLLELRIPRETDLAAELTTLGSFIEIRRDGNFEAIYLIRAVEIESGALVYSRGVQDIANAVYVGGQGEGTERLVVLKENLPSIAAVGRFERFLDARDIELDNLPLLLERAEAAVSTVSIPESAVANVGAPVLQDMITVRGVSPMIYAAGRIVLPPPATRSAGSDLIQVSGDVYDRIADVPADVAMAHYVRQHLVEPNDTTRKVPLLTIPAVGGVLPMASYTSRFQTVLEVLQDLAINSDSGYEIVRSGGELQFVVQPVRDRTATSSNPVIVRDDEILLDISGRAYRAEWDVGDRITLELRNGYRVDLRIFQITGELQAGRAVEISLGVVLEASGNLLGSIAEAAAGRNTSIVRVEGQGGAGDGSAGGIVHYDYVVDPNYTGVSGDTILLATDSTVRIYKTVQEAVNAAVVVGRPISILLNAADYAEDVAFPATLTGDLWLYGEGVNKVSIRSITISTTQVLHFKNIRVLTPTLAALGIALVHDAGGGSTWDISYAATPWTTVALPATVTHERPRPLCLTNKLWFVPSVGGFPDPTSKSAGNECNRELVRSTNGGATWAATVVGDETCATDRAQAGDEINHFARVAMDAGGRIWAARKRGTTTAHPIRTEIWSSDHQGATLTWILRATLSVASAARHPYALLCHPTDPNIIALVSASEYGPAGGDKGVVIHYSLDRGASWSTSAPTVASGNNFSLTGEPPNGQAFRAMVLPNGRIVIASRETLIVSFRIITSDDNGLTWQLRYTDAEVNNDNMLLFTQGQWRDNGQRLVGVRVPVLGGVATAWAILESLDSGTTWSVRAIPAPDTDIVNEWDAVYSPATDTVIVQNGGNTTTNRVLTLINAVSGGTVWTDVTGDLPSSPPTNMHWEGIALAPAVTASVTGTVSNIETHWEDCKIEGDLDIDLRHSSFRRCLLFYSVSLDDVDVILAECRFSPFPSFISTLPKGAGVPTHTAPEGTLYWDITNNLLYVNSDGGTIWVTAGGGDPALFDAIVDGIGTRTGHYTEITAAIAAAKVNIAVLPKPSAGRYAAFTVAAGDACRSVQGIGPGVLVGAVTVNKADVLLKQLESNARVTLGTARVTCERVVCNAAADTGFTIDLLGSGGLGTRLLDCRVVQTTGIALNLGDSNTDILVQNLHLRNCTGPNLIKNVSVGGTPGATFLNLDADDTSNAPTAEAILLNAEGTWIFLNALLGTVTAAPGFPVVSVTSARLFVWDTGTVSDDGVATPGIYLDNSQAGVFKLMNVRSAGLALLSLATLPATSIGLTEFEACSTLAATIVAGAGLWNGRSNVTVSGIFLTDRYQFAGAAPAVDNQRIWGSSALAWSQVWGYILGVKNYAEFRNVAAPAIGVAMARAYAEGGWLKHKSSALQVNAPLSHVGNLSTTPVTVANTVVETVLGTFTIPANAMVVGKTLRITARGVYGTDALGPILELRVRWGGVAGVLMATDGGAALNAIVHTNRGWEVSFDACFVTVGAAGTAECQGFAALADTAILAAQRDMENAAVIAALPTNASQAFVLTAQWGTADVANTITIRQWIVEVLN